MLLLISCLEWLWKDRQDFYCAGNLTIYYGLQQPKPEQFRGPDFFVVLGTERKSRKSWVVWEEGKYPNVIVEILSLTTAATDRGLKKQIYQDVFRTPNYFWLDPVNLELKGFQLIAGQYQELQSNAQGWLWSQKLELFLGIFNSQLRFFTPTGKLVETPEVLATIAQAELSITQQELAIAQQELARERFQRERLAARLREMGIDPEI
jgi:Uma2 family endonuclease